MREDKSLTLLLKAKAAELGFAACGIAHADAAPRSGARLRQWLGEGMHGDMIWMETRAHHRESPAALWPEVKSVIALGMSYAPAADPLALAGEGETGRISVYAQGADYHDVVKRALKALARALVAEARDADVKVFVDTAPVMEKPLAEAAGLGWQGKHSNLVSRDHGSWLFLGAIYTTLDLAPDVPGRDRCGSCDACQRACPTDAFPAPYRLDARRCISYLTIEHAGPIPHRIPRGDRQPHLWVRRLPGGVPVEQVRRLGAGKSGLRAACRARRARAGRPACRSTTRIFGRCSRAPRSSASGGTG